MKKTSKEDYLKAIYLIYEKQGDKTAGIKSIGIAKSLGISKPSVSAMIKKLAKEGFLKVKPYSKIFFTKKGLREAKRITHNYRVIGVFLKDILKYDLNKIHKEAHKLEHAFSEESIRRLDKFLGDPKRCPHGEIIHENNNG